MACPLCNGGDTRSIYSVENIPVFQNKVFASPAAAHGAVTGSVDLQQCQFCNFIYNASFDDSLMDYDSDYQNEQANSAHFQAHLDGVLDSLRPLLQSSPRIIEIGCGKGHFLDMVVAAGFGITGFDPAFEGENPNIRKDYFSEKYSDIEADLIVLRHTLEHIGEPLKFLHHIAKANNYRGRIFIEVPDADWIFANYAFWDVFFEHCNYFTRQTLGSLFNHCEAGSLFDGQYQYVIAELSALKHVSELEQQEPIELPDLGNRLAIYREKVSAAAPLLVWGAGAKGSTFANLVDPDGRLIRAVVDINPRKAGRYLAKSGHEILDPDTALQLLESPFVLVMNANYQSEIEAQIESLGIAATCCSLENLPTYAG